MRRLNLDYKNMSENDLRLVEEAYRHNDWTRIDEDKAETEAGRRGLHLIEQCLRLWEEGEGRDW